MRVRESPLEVSMFQYVSEAPLDRLMISHLGVVGGLGRVFILALFRMKILASIPYFLDVENTYYGRYILCFCDRLRARGFHKTSS